MLELSAKHAEMGIINNRLEKRGPTEEVTAFDIPLTVLLDPKELNELLDKRHAHAALFNTPKGCVATPIFPEFKALHVEMIFENANVSLQLGVSDNLIDFEDARIKVQSLQPVHGGETEARLQLQVIPGAKQITRLLDAQNSELKVSITDARRAEKKNTKQESLPLGPPAAAAATEGDAGEEGDGNGKVHDIKSVKGKSSSTGKDRPHPENAH
jgi:hypothetical protein